MKKLSTLAGFLLLMGCNPLKADMKTEAFDKPAENPILRADSFISVAIAE